MFFQKSQMTQMKRCVFLEKSQMKYHFQKSQDDLFVSIKNEILEKKKYLSIVIHNFIFQSLFL